MRVIFLDFDGVLHPRISPDKLFVHVDRLSHVLKDHPDVKIVVSSSWRAAHAIKQLCHFLGPLKSRVVDVTEQIRGATRQAEVEAWLAEKEDVSWVAIDDDPRLFQPDCDWLLVTHHKTGMDQKDCARLRTWLETGLLPTEVATEFKCCMKHMGSCAADLPVRAFVYPRARRLQIEVPHFDSVLLIEFLEGVSRQSGVEDLWREDTGWSPRYAVWDMEIRIDRAAFRLEAIRLGAYRSALHTLVLTPVVEPSAQQRQS